MAFPTLAPRLSRVACAGAAVGLAVALSACSSGSAPDPTTPDDSSTATATLSTPTIISDGELTVCAALLSPPNVYTDQATGEAIGAEVDLADALATQLGLKLKLNEVGFPGLIPALQAKQCDTIMSSLYIKPEREAVVDFVPYLKSGSALVTQAGNPKKITGFDDSLCGLRIVVQTGSTGATLIEQRSQECEAEGKPAVVITSTDSPGTALQQVMADQQDAHITTLEGAGYYDKLGDFSFAGKPFGEIEVGAATLKTNTELHDALQGALDAIIADGTYDSILDEWGVQASSIEK